MIKITNILVATDFSDASAAALTYGRERVRSYGAKLHVIVDYLESIQVLR